MLPLGGRVCLPAAGGKTLPYAFRKTLSGTREETTEKADSGRALRGIYERHGYIRVKVDKRLGGKRTGWEIRLSLPTRREAESVRALLRKLQLRAGKVFTKHDRYVIPLYGRRQVELFLQKIKPDSKNAIPKRF